LSINRTAGKVEIAVSDERVEVPDRADRIDLDAVSTALAGALKRSPDVTGALVRPGDALDHGSLIALLLVAHTALPDLALTTEAPE
ncbi:MAG: hypothetical protein KC620_20130, partial [Myxococcales bacterium]|nr:hypothetical protein [Myxococcales bacterium]